MCEELGLDFYEFCWNNGGLKPELCENNYSKKEKEQPDENNDSAHLLKKFSLVALF